MKNMRKKINNWRKLYNGRQVTIFEKATAVEMETAALEAAAVYEPLMLFALMDTIHRIGIAIGRNII